MLNFSLVQTQHAISLLLKYVFPSNQTSKPGFFSRLSSDKSEMQYYFCWNLSLGLPMIHHRPVLGTFHDVGAANFQDVGAATSAPMRSR